MTPITTTLGKIITMSCLIYGIISLLIAFGAGLPVDWLAFLKVANGSIWKIFGFMLLCLWISERLVNRFLCRL